MFKQLNLEPVDASNLYVNQLEKRPLLKRIVNNLKPIQAKLGLNRFEISREIPQISYMGITGYKKGVYKAVYVEVLDDYTRIKNVEEDTPVGLMALKLRLLDQTDQGLVVVNISLF